MVFCKKVNRQSAVRSLVGTSLEVCLQSEGHRQSGPDTLAGEEPRRDGTKWQQGTTTEGRCQSWNYTHDPVKERGNRDESDNEWMR